MKTKMNLLLSMKNHYMICSFILITTFALILCNCSNFQKESDIIKDSFTSKFINAKINNHVNNNKDFLDKIIQLSKEVESNSSIEIDDYQNIIDDIILCGVFKIQEAIPYLQKILQTNCNIKIDNAFYDDSSQLRKTLLGPLSSYTKKKRFEKSFNPLEEVIIKSLLLFNDKNIYTEALKYFNKYNVYLFFSRINSLDTSGQDIASQIDLKDFLKVEKLNSIKTLFNYFDEKTKNELWKDAISSHEESNVKSAILVLTKGYISNSFAENQIIDVLSSSANESIKPFLYDALSICGSEKTVNFILNKCSEEDLYYGLVTLRYISKISNLDALIRKFSQLKDENLKQEILYTISTFGGEKVKEFCIKQLKSSSTKVKQYLINTLSNLYDYSLLDYFIEFLKSDEYEIKLAALDAINKFKGVNVNKKIKHFVNDDDPKIREMTYKILSHYDDEQSEKLLLNGLNDKSFEIRKIILDALISKGKLNYFPNVILLINDSNLEVKLKVLEFIKIFNNEYTLDILLKLIDSYDPYIRSNALNCFRYIKYDNIIKKASKILQNENIDVKVSAIQAICNQDNEDGFKLINTFINDDNHSIKLNSIYNLIKAGKKDINYNVNDYVFSDDREYQNLSLNILFSTTNSVDKIFPAYFDYHITKFLLNNDVKYLTFPAIAYKYLLTNINEENKKLVTDYYNLKMSDYDYLSLNSDDIELFSKYKIESFLTYLKNLYFSSDNVTKYDIVKALVLFQDKNSIDIILQYLDTLDIFNQMINVDSITSKLISWEGDELERALIMSLDSNSILLKSNSIIILAKRKCIAPKNIITQLIKNGSYLEKLAGLYYYASLGISYEKIDQLFVSNKTIILTLLHNICLVQNGNIDSIKKIIHDYDSYDFFSKNVLMHFLKTLSSKYNTSELLKRMAADESWSIRKKLISIINQKN